MHACHIPRIYPKQTFSRYYDDERDQFPCMMVLLIIFIQIIIAPKNNTFIFLKQKEKFLTNLLKTLKKTLLYHFILGVSLFTLSHRKWVCDGAAPDYYLFLLITQ